MFLQKFDMGIKNAKVDADFESIEKKIQKIHLNEDRGRKHLHTVIKVKNSIFRSLFRDNFLRIMSLLQFQRILYQHQFLRF